jgi:signal transduction histidine kinase
LQKDLSRPKDSEQRESPLPGTDTLEGELHLALEEISRLRAAQTSVTDTITTPTPGILTKLDPQGNQLKTFAHELRQPMSSIVGYTDYLLGESVGILGNLQRKFLERINFSAERMSTILDDMFHATSLESNTLKLNPEQVNLYDIINQALQKSSDSMHQKDIDLRVDIPEILPALITDPAALEQVIITLLKNACEVSPQQGQISIRMDIYGEGINLGFGLLQVTNQGGGIATEDISRVFSRQHQNTIPGVGDSGTNLSKIKTLVEALEGRIWVDSLPGIGAIFSVLLPVLPAGSAPDGGNSQ